MSRTLTLIGAVLAAATGALASWPADAFDRYRECWGVEGYCDPYAYEPEKPRYYPHSNSGEWAPASEYRRPPYNHIIPPYYQAWGRPRAERYYDEERERWIEYPLGH